MDASTSDVRDVEPVGLFPAKKVTISCDARSDEPLPIAVSWHTEVDFSQLDDDVVRLKSYQPGGAGIRAGASLMNGKIRLPYPSTRSRRFGGKIELDVDGKSFEGEGDGRATSSMLLCVMDPDQRELQILPFQDVFLRLKMETDDVPSPQTASDERSLQTPGSVSKFSSKAKRRRVQELSSASQKVKHETAGVVAIEEDKDINAIIESSKGDEVDVGLAEGIRPTPNFSAGSPEELYDWNSVVPRDVLTSLLPMAEEISATIEDSFDDWRKAGRFSSYSLNLMRSVPVNASDRMERLALAVAIDELLALFNRPMKPMDAKAVVRNRGAAMPDDFVNYVTKNFTSQSHLNAKQRILSAKLKDKILAYALLWILKSESFSADVTALMSDLRAKDRSKVQSIALVIGARCSEKEEKDKKVYTLNLKAPWAFPKISAGTPRKKKRN